MRFTRIGLMVLVVCVVFLNTGAEKPPSLPNRIAEILAVEDGQGAFWGVYIRNLDTDRVIYSLNADKTLIPASSQKLLTTSTALIALGSDYEYQTGLYLSGVVEEDVIQGDLIIRGSGDPTFGSTEISGENPLRAWARALSNMGIKRIEGHVIGDDDVFDDNPYAEGWDIDYLTTQSSRYLGVSSGGLSYRDNVVEVKIVATQPGSPPTVSMYPEGFLQVRNNLTTSSQRRGIAVTTSRDIGTETIVLEGSLPAVYTGTIIMPVTNPTTFTLHNFKRYLEDAGIDVQGQLFDVDTMDRLPNYDTFQRLFTHVSPPMSEILKVVNKESNNFYADQVFRTFSWEGSAIGGEKRIKDVLSRAGINRASMSIRDGSGLSRKDLITAEAMGLMLAYMSRHSENEAFLSTLPMGGERYSTLEYRLADIPVQAKTGSLEYVRSLSGYTTAANGHKLAFVLFANNYTVPAYRINQTIDRVVRMLAASSP